MTCLSVNCLKQMSQELMKQRWIKVLLFCYCIFCTFFFGSAHISKLFCWFFRESVWPKYTQHYIVINLEENFFLLIALSLSLAADGWLYTSDGSGIQNMSFGTHFNWCGTFSNKMNKHFSLFYAQKNVALISCTRSITSWL